MSHSVLFVCLGNICRSPLAEAALRLECASSELNVVIDSAGTGDWHVGQPPDERAQAAAIRNGVEIGHLRARQVTAADFHDFDHIIALDNQNLRDLTAMPSAVGDLSFLTENVSNNSVANRFYLSDPSVIFWRASPVSLEKHALLPDIKTNRACFVGSLN